MKHGALKLVSKTTLLAFVMLQTACSFETTIRDTFVDRTAPDAAQGLQWWDGSTPVSDASYSSSPSMKARWTPSTSTDMTSQAVQLFIGASCNIASGTPVRYTGVTQNEHVFSGLPDGSYSFKIISYDRKNNASYTDCSSSFTVDQSGPALTVTNGAWINSSNKTAYTVSGTCADSGMGISGVTNSVTVRLEKDASNYREVTTDCIAGNYTVNLDAETAATAGAISDGSNHLTLTVSMDDLLGNHTSVSGQSVSKDTIAPALTSISPPTWINLANLANYTISGTCTEETSGINGNITVTVTDGTANGTVTGTATCTGIVAGVGSFTTTVNATALADTASGAATGNVSITASATDLAGNSFTTASITRKKDAVAPVISITSPLTTTYVKATAVIPVNFTLVETNALSGQNFNIAYNNNTSITNSNVPLTNGPFTSASPGTFSHSISTAGLADGTGVSVAISYTDLAGNPAAVANASYTIDTGVPTVNELTVVGGSGVLTNNNIKVSLKASNLRSPITHFCLKYDNNTAPLDTDSCWTGVSTTSQSVPASSIEITNFDFQIGFVRAEYTLYAWAKNQAGLISTLGNNGNGLEGHDQYTLNYDPGHPPVITALSATRSSDPTAPIPTSELQFTTGADLYVKWNASDVDDGGDGLATNPISIFYTTNDITYSPLVQNVANAPGVGCVVPAGYTGCYKLTSPVAAGSYFKVRVVAKDKNSTTVFYNSDPLNVTNLKIIAGNTETGIGGSAMSAVFSPFAKASSVGYLSNLHLAVSTDGKYFYINPYDGLVWVDSSTGNLEVFIPKTGTSSADNVSGSNVSSATLKNPLAITMDYQNNLLILDHDRIRKVNLSTMKITTMIGGGSTLLNTKTQILDANAVSLHSLNVAYSGFIGLTMIPLPNGDFLFSTDLGSGVRNTSLVDYKYIQASNTIEPINYVDETKSENPQGMGSSPTFSWKGDGPNAWTSSIGFALDFDPDNFNPTYLIKGFMRNFGENDTYPMSTRFDYRTKDSGFNYTEMGINNLSQLDKGQLFTGLNGKMYFVNRWRTKIFQYRPDVNALVPLLGTASINDAGEVGTIPNSLCADNTTATSCSVDIEAAFVTRNNRLYFVDQGALRTVVDGKVITVFGQFLSYGAGLNGIASVNARFGTIEDLKVDPTDSNRSVVLDSFAGYYRDVNQNGNANTLQNVQYSMFGPFKFELDPFTGDVFSPEGLNVFRIPKNGDPKISVVGGGAYSYFDPAAEGKTGSQINLYSSYQVSLVGLVDHQLYYAKHSYISNTTTQCMVKKYDITNDFIQSHFVGSSSCNYNWTAGGSGIGYDVARVEYSTVLGKNLIYQVGSNYMKSITAGGTLENLFYIHQQSAGLHFNTFTHVDDPNGVDVHVYYCLHDSNIYRYTYNKNSQTGSSVAIPLGAPIYCKKPSSLNYSSTKRSITFAFSQKGLDGIAEFFLP